MGPNLFGRFRTSLLQGCVKGNACDGLSRSVVRVRGFRQSQNLLHSIGNSNILATDGCEIKERHKARLRRRWKGNSVGAGHASTTSKMPHALTGHDAQEALDDLLIQQALDPESNLDFSRDLEPGEKADDAIDYEDLSDNDLAEDEDVQTTQSSSKETEGGNGQSFESMVSLAQEEEDLPDLTNGSGAENDGFDDLFGDIPSSPVDVGDNLPVTHNGVQADGIDISLDFENGGQFTDSSHTPPDAPFSIEPKAIPASSQPIFRTVNFNPKDAALSKEQLLQQQLFAMSASGLGNAEYPPAPPENQEELLASLWPKYKRDTVPRFMDLLPPKQARYIGKTPLKVPKPVHPTKISLELAPDQEKNFTVNASSNKRSRQDYEQQGLVLVSSAASEESTGDEDLEFNSDFETESVGGVTWQDLQVICEDWKIYSPPLYSSPNQKERKDISMANQDDIFRDLDEEWETSGDARSAKVCQLIILFSIVAK